MQGSLKRLCFRKSDRTQTAIFYMEGINHGRNRHQRPCGDRKNCRRNRFSCWEPMDRLDRASESVENSKDEALAHWQAGSTLRSDCSLAIESQRAGLDGDQPDES